MALRNSRFYDSQVSWDDVGGLTEAKQVLRKVLEFPTKYRVLLEAAPIRLPTGVLLYGPPGLYSFKMEICHL